jgi:hypothetical protein
VESVLRVVTVMTRFTFATFIVEAPAGWRNITASTVLVGGQPLPSLARENGVGDIAFTVHRYREDPNRAPSPDELLERVREYGRDLGAGEPFSVALEAEPLWLAAGSYRWDGAFVRVWHVSDGCGLAFVTYDCPYGRESLELATCEQVVRSIRFRYGILRRFLGLV